MSVINSRKGHGKNLGLIIGKLTCSLFDVIHIVEVYYEDVVVHASTSQLADGASSNLPDL